MLSVIYWSFSGFDSASTFAGEVKEPHRTFPLALTLAVITMLASYIAPLLVAAGADPSWPCWEVRMHACRGGHGPLPPRVGRCNAAATRAAHLPGGGGRRVEAGEGMGWDGMWDGVGWDGIWLTSPAEVDAKRQRHRHVAARDRHLAAVRPPCHRRVTAPLSQRTDLSPSHPIPSHLIPSRPVPSRRALAKDGSLSTVGYTIGGAWLGCTILAASALGNWGLYASELL